MKTLLHICIATALACFPAFAEPKAPKKKAAAEEHAEPDANQPRWVVILGVYKDFKEAKTSAEKYAKASGMVFSMNGNVFTKKGLHMPDDLDDELFAGKYLARRENTFTEGEKPPQPYISVERSDGYDGFAKGYYIIVGAIAEDAATGKALV